MRSILLILLSLQTLSVQASENSELVARMLEYGDHKVIQNMGDFFADQVRVNGEEINLETLIVKEAQRVATLLIERLEVIDSFFFEDKCVAYCKFHGIQVGNWEGIPANYQKFTTPVMLMYKFQNGKICEVWSTCDKLNILRQIEKIEMEDMQKEEKYIQLVQKLLEGTLDPKNISTYDQIFAENIRMHGPFNGYEGDLNLSLAKEFDAWLAKTFRKEKMDLQEIFVHEDKVIVYWILHCTQYQTGNKYIISGTSMYRIADDKINEIWQSWDTSSLIEMLENAPDFSSPQAFLKGAKNDPITLFGLEKYRKQVDSLSDRECECLKQLVLGKTAAEIGQSLHLSPRTIESYLENLKEKLSCHSKRELFSRARLFFKLKLI